MIVVALGANLSSAIGPPAVTIRAALDALRDAGVVPRTVSQFWQTPAWPDPRDAPYVNAVAIIEMALSPEALLQVLHRVEAQFGRDRSAHAQRNAPRTLDLDLLDYNGRVQAGPPELPHPRMAERAFVLMPLREVAPDWRHPVTGRGVNELIADLPPQRMAEMTQLKV